MNNTVKITLDVPKVLRMNIRIAAAAKDRTVAAEIRDTLMKRYVPACPQAAGAQE